MFKLLKITTIVFFLVLLGDVSGFVIKPMAQETNKLEEQSLMDTNWDEEGTDEEDTVSAESWQEEDTVEASEEDNRAMGILSKADLEKVEAEEKRIHIYGFLLFAIYVLGCILTAYMTRNKRIATEYPPELLILLHTVWPLEIIIVLVMGIKK